MKNRMMCLLVMGCLFIACTGTDNTVAPAGTGETAASAGGAVESQRVSFGAISLEIPVSWEPQQPSSRMRMAQYGLPAAPGDAQGGECALFHFPGTGGTVEANLQRWYGQFQQPDGSSTADAAEVETFAAGGMNVTVVQVAGTYSASMGPMAHGGEPQPGFGMVAGVVETAAGPWFLKCVGPEATVRTAAPGVRAAMSSAEGG